MEKEKTTNVILPQEVVDEAARFLEGHKRELKVIGIKTVSHLFVRGWYHYEDYIMQTIKKALGP